MTKAPDFQLKTENSNLNKRLNWGARLDNLHKYSVRSTSIMWWNNNGAKLLQRFLAKKLLDKL